MGDVLFTCVNLARHLDLDPETTLRAANARFERRFRRMEGLLRERGGVERVGAAEREAAWQASKAPGEAADDPEGLRS